jgi:hypothetical protein
MNEYAYITQHIRRFNPEDGGSMFLQNGGIHPQDYV